MAEINIQRKEKSMWPWIVGGLILLLVILFLAGVFDGDKNIYDRTATVDTTMQRPAPAASEFPDEVRDYLAYVRGHDTTAMDVSHDYDSKALMYLADALDALADRDYVGNTEVENTRKILREKADKLQDDPASKNHADMLRDAAMSASNLMEVMQKAQYPDLTGAVAEARSAAMAIVPGKPALDQKQTTQNFFLKAGVVLEAMGRRKA
jgi:hypothetical protein